MGEYQTPFADVENPFLRSLPLNVPYFFAIG